MTGRQSSDSAGHHPAAHPPFRAAGAAVNASASGTIGCTMSLDTSTVAEGLVPSAEQAARNSQVFEQIPRRAAIGQKMLSL